MFNDFRLQLDRLHAKKDLLSSPDRLNEANRRLEFYVKIVTKVVEAERCSVFITDPAQNKTWLKAGTGVAERDIEVPNDDSVVAKVIRTGEPLIVNDLNKCEGTHKTIDAKTGFVTRDILCVPVKSAEHKETIGAFEALNKTDGRAFNDEDLTTVQEIADHLRADIDSIFLQQEFLRLNEKMYSTARRAVSFLVGGIVVLVAILLLLVATYIVTPAFGG